MRFDDPNCTVGTMRRMNIATGAYGESLEEDLEEEEEEEEEPVVVEEDDDEIGVAVREPVDSTGACNSIGRWRGTRRPSEEEGAYEKSSNSRQEGTRQEKGEKEAGKESREEACREKESGKEEASQEKAAKKNLPTTTT